MHLFAQASACAKASGLKLWNINRVGFPSVLVAERGTKLLTLRLPKHPTQITPAHSGKVSTLDGPLLHQSC